VCHGDVVYEQSFVGFVELCWLCWACLAHTRCHPRIHVPFPSQSLVSHVVEFS